MNQRLRTNLSIVNPDGTALLADGVLNDFGNYDDEVDGMDAKKLANLNENLSVKSAGRLLAVERKSLITKNDTIFLDLSGVRVQSYRFELIADKFDHTGLTAFLEDNYLHAKTPLDLTGVTLIDFTVVNVAGSYAPDRFRIVFIPGVVLPVSFTSVKAYEHGEYIDVKWTVENEMNIRQYDVEKSMDGTLFFTIAIKEVSVTEAHFEYTIKDSNPVEGNNFYRVKSVDLNGRIVYSNIVKVQTGSARQNIIVYPNPAIQGALGLQFINEPGGTYCIRLFNKTGQLIRSKQINHAEGVSNEVIKWNHNLAAGVYHVEVTRPGGEIKKIEVVY